MYYFRDEIIVNKYYVHYFPISSITFFMGHNADYQNIDYRMWEKTMVYYLTLFTFSPSPKLVESYTLHSLLYCRPHSFNVVMFLWLEEKGWHYNSYTAHLITLNIHVIFCDLYMALSSAATLCRF